jgi:hypothetical protein
MLPRPPRKALAAWDELREAFAGITGREADYLDL